MPLKSRIPYGKSSSRIPSTTKLPHPTSKLKSSTTSLPGAVKNSGPKSEDSLQQVQRVRSLPHCELSADEDSGSNATFICKTNSGRSLDINGNGNAHSNTVNAVPPRSSLFISQQRLPKQESLDNCEVLSVASAGPSPIKQLESEHEIGDFVSSDDLDSFDVNDSYTTLIDDSNSSVHSDPTDRLVDDEAPDLVAFRRFQEVLNAPRGPSPTAEVESARPRLPLPSASVQNTGLLRPSKKFPPKSVVAKPVTGSSAAAKATNGKFASKSVKSTARASKPSNASSFVKNCLSRTHKSGKSSETRTVIKQQKLGTSRGKDTELSATNTMDYVRKVTSQQQLPGDSPGNRRRLRTGQDSQAMHRYNGKSDLTELPARASARQPVNSRSDGKWSTDIDSAMNVARRSSRPLLESNTETRSESGSTQRSGRKKLYQEVRNTAVQQRLNDGKSSSDAGNDVAADSSGRPSIRSNSGTSMSDSKSPRIVRPVQRPTRTRARASSPTVKRDVTEAPEAEPAPAVQEGGDLRNGERDSSAEDETFDTSEEVVRQRRAFNRRRSVPASMLGRATESTAPRSRMRRRASEYSGKHLMPDVDEDFHESGDSVESDIARMHQRLAQNERYKEILQNPDIVTFGHYRIQQEGNYAPEEMYGITERRRIRSSSGSVSPQGKSRPFPAEDFLSKSSSSSSEKTPKSTGEAISKDLHNPASVSSMDDQILSAKESESLTENLLTEDEVENISALDNLPSLNSTALMADYSLESSNLSQDKSHASHKMMSDSALDSQTHSPMRQKVINKHLEKGLNGRVESEPRASDKWKPSRSGLNPKMHSSPLKLKDSSLTRLEFSGASRGELIEKLDEMLEENKVVKVALEQLYKKLDDEERQKQRLEDENELLLKKGDEMKKEVRSLTKALEVQQSSSPLQNPRSRIRNALNSSIQTCTESTPTQTDAELTPTWFKTELSSAGKSLQDAVEQLQKVRNAKRDFDEIISEAEEKLKGLVTSVYQD